MLTNLNPDNLEVFLGRVIEKLDNIQREIKKLNETQINSTKLIQDNQTRLTRIETTGDVIKFIVPIVCGIIAMIVSALTSYILKLGGGFGGV